METYNKVAEQKRIISVIGLGYVGMPIAVAFSKKTEVIGYDINSKKLKCINRV